MYFVSLYGDNGILRLNCDYKEGKPSVSLHPIVNGQVNWQSRAYLSITLDEMIQLYMMIKNWNGQATLDLQKGQSTLKILVTNDMIDVHHTFQNNPTRVTISNNSVAVEHFKNWVKFSVEVFPGLSSMFHDLISVIKPEYYQQRANQWRGNNQGYQNNGNAYQQNSYQQNGYQQNNWQQNNQNRNVAYGGNPVNAQGYNNIPNQNTPNQTYTPPTNAPTQNVQRPTTPTNVGQNNQQSTTDINNLFATVSTDDDI